MTLWLKSSARIAMIDLLAIEAWLSRYYTLRSNQSKFCGMAHGERVRYQIETPPICQS